MVKRFPGLLILLAMISALGAQSLENESALRNEFLQARKEQPRQVPPGADPADPPLGLGFTIFKKAAHGVPHRVDPTTIFRTGEAIRFVVEPQRKGYCYLFVSENNSAFKLVFPSPHIAGGKNFLPAHYLSEIPSRRASDPKEQWYVFGKQPGPVEFIFVFDNHQLSEIPAGLELRKFEKRSAGQKWIMPEKLWEALMAIKSYPMRTHQLTAQNQALHPDEIASITRGVRLKFKSPGPTVIKQHKETSSTWLVFGITLLHQ